MRHEGRILVMEGSGVVKKGNSMASNPPNPPSTSVTRLMMTWGVLGIRMLLIGRQKEERSDELTKLALGQ